MSVRFWRQHYFGWTLWLVIGLATPGLGCARFRPAPLVPTRTAAAFESRRLDSLDLKTFLEANLHHSLPNWPVREWDLETLTLVAFYYHPDLEMARAHMAVAEAGVITAGGRPNPSIGFTPEAIANATAGISPWTLGFTFDVPIETMGKRGYRIRRAKQLTEAARLELAETAWRVRSRLRITVMEHFLAQRELDLLRAEASLRAETLTSLDRRYGVGQASLQALTAARTDLANTQRAVEAAAGRLAESQVALASALGLPVSALDGVKLSWPALDQPPTEATLPPELIQREGLLNRLDVRRALAEYAAAEAALQLEIAKQYPDIHLGPGYSWDQGDNKFALGLSVTLPLFNQNQGPIAEAEAHRKEAAARFVALQAHVIGELDQALARYRAALAELAEANHAVLELHELQLQRTQPWAAAATDPLVLTEWLTQRAVVTQARLEALHKTQAALGALEDAVQHPLDETRTATSPPPKAGVGVTPVTASER